MLDVLFESESLPRYRIPAELRERYGGAIGFDEPRVIANFVATVDGVAATPEVPGSNRLIGGASAPDRFVMGLLRACAGAVVVGAGTMRAEPRALWTAQAIFPAAAGAFADLRRDLGLAVDPQLVVLAGRGTLDPEHPALRRGALVLAPSDRVQQLRAAMPRQTTVRACGNGELVDVGEALRVVQHELAHRVVLAEAGPHVFGDMLSRGLVDELFLTIAPRLAGRSATDERFALVEGAALLPQVHQQAQLLAVRRAGDELQLRYALQPREPKRNGLAVV